MIYYVASEIYEGCRDGGEGFILGVTEEQAAELDPLIDEHESWVPARLVDWLADSKYDTFGDWPFKGEIRNSFIIYWDD